MVLSGIFPLDKWEPFTNTEAPIVFPNTNEVRITLIERVRMAAPEMFELNCNYTGAIQLSF